jgi:hypothetical protein
MNRLRLDLLFFLSLGAFGLLQPACGGETNQATTSAGGSGPASSSSSSGGVGGMPSGSTGGSMPMVLECPGAGTTTVPLGDCDLLQQDCPVGAGCEPVPIGGGEWQSQCVFENGLKEAGDFCSTGSQCKPGLECVFDKCVPPCCPDNDEPCQGGLCNVINDQNYGPYEVYFCSFLTSCELFDPTSCDNGVEGNCYPTPNGYSFCAPPGPDVGGEGEPCENLNGCEANMFCAGALNSVCRWACYLDMSSTVAGEGGCPMGQTCGDVNFGIPNIGLCQ